MNPFEEPAPSETSFIKRHRFLAILLGVVLIAFIGGAARLLSKQSSAPRREVPLTMVSLALPTPVPTPPPPPPAPTPPPPEEKMVEQAPVNEHEEKPDDKPAPKEEPAVTTSIQGGGPADGFGLGGGGRGLGGNGSGKRGGGSRWGWYAGQVQSRIAEALRNHRKTRSAALSLQVRIWPDATGRVTRAQVVGSTGDPALANAIQSEILPGLQLQEPPPAGMPLPIVMRISARRPN